MRVENSIKFAFVSDSTSALLLIKQRQMFESRNFGKTALMTSVEISMTPNLDVGDFIFNLLNLNCKFIRL